MCCLAAFGNQTQSQRSAKKVTKLVHYPFNNQQSQIVVYRLHVVVVCSGPGNKSRPASARHIHCDCSRFRCGCPRKGGIRIPLNPFSQDITEKVVAVSAVGCLESNRWSLNSKLKGKLFTSISVMYIKLMVFCLTL